LARREAQERRQRKGEEVAEKFRGQFRDILGSAHFTELRDLMRRERMAFRDLLLPPTGLKLDFRKANSRRKAKADALLRRLGVDKAKLHAIGRESRAALAEVFTSGGPEAGSGYSLNLHAREWRGLSPYNEVAWPGDVEPSNDPHRWFFFTTPYLGEDTDFWVGESSSADCTAGIEINMASGLVGVAPASMQIEDADDIDFAAVEAHAAVMCWFEAPATGLVEVLIDAQNLNGDHHLYTENEWGWSDSETEQTSHLMLKLFHPSSPDLSLALMSRFHLVTDDDQTTNRTYLQRGQHYFARLFSDGPVQAGEHVYIAAGAHSHDSCFSSDVGIDSKSTFRWFIKSVQARIAP